MKIMDPNRQKVDFANISIEKCLGNFFGTIFLKNFFGFLISIPNGIRKKMKVENLRLDLVYDTPNAK